jgi:hypothetical protein
MLRVTLMSSALVALFALTACEQPNQSAQNTGSSATPSSTDTAMNDTAPAPAPSDQTTMPGDQYGAAPAPGAPAAGTPLTDVQNPQTTLAKASVKDSKGEAIGEVKSVSMTADGKIDVVNVGIGTRTVALKPDGLTYQQAENTIMTTQTKEEIQKMK